MDFNCIDAASAALIIRLHLEDSAELFEATVGKGKAPEGVLPDTQIAVNIYKEDLERNALIFTDRQMTVSIARACQTDGDLLKSVQSQEQIAAGDRVEAFRINVQTAVNDVAPWTVSSEYLDEEVLAKLEALYVATPNDDEDPEGPEADTIERKEPHAESSACASARRPTQTPKRQCVACLDRFPFHELARAPCNHEYCREYLRELFRNSITDDMLFPPRCCRQPIKFGGGINILLASELVKQYEAKKIKFETPNRTYCSNQSCSSFIQLASIERDRAECPDCGTSTCTMCKALSHDGDCPADTALQRVLEVATEHDWQRCFNCRRLVELDTGCNHMTCPCGFQFCYVCGGRWKTCQCEQWDENRLVVRANIVVARQPTQINAALENARRAAFVQDLRDRHNCDHERWRYVRGEHQCEECRHMLPQYIFECQQCHIRACNRCKLNRL